MAECDCVGVSFPQPALLAVHAASRFHPRSSGHCACVASHFGGDALWLAGFDQTKTGVSHIVFGDASCSEKKVREARVSEPSCCRQSATGPLSKNNGVTCDNETIFHPVSLFAWTDVTPSASTERGFDDAYSDS